jgi:hypothetical protein
MRRHPKEPARLVHLASGVLEVKNTSWLEHRVATAGRVTHAPAMAGARLDIGWPRPAAVPFGSARLEGRP